MAASVGTSKTRTAVLIVVETSAALSALAMFALHIAHWAGAEIAVAAISAATPNRNLATVRYRER
jgi:hypothetical protein